MARILKNVARVDNSTADYPNGRIRDKATGIDGTPITEQIYGDIVQFFQKLLRLASINANGQPDNETNGYQYITALTNKIYKDAEIIRNYDGANQTHVFVNETPDYDYDLNSSEESIFYLSKHSDDLNLVSGGGAFRTPVIYNLAFKLNEINGFPPPNTPRYATIGNNASFLGNSSSVYLYSDSDSEIGKWYPVTLYYKTGDLPKFHIVHNSNVRVKVLSIKS